MSATYVPTLTLQGTVERFREAGIHTSETKIAACLEQNIYPFGFCVVIDGKRNFEIYAKEVEEYLAARAVPDGTSP